MSEQTIQTAIQTTLGALANFQPGAVVINDWRRLDGSLQLSPYAIIETADQFNSRQDSVTPVTQWVIPVTILVRFTDWPESYNALRDLRQAIIDGFNTVGDDRSPGAGAVLASVIRSDGPVGEWYDNYNGQPGPAPIFITQRLVLEVEEF